MENIDDKTEAKTIEEGFTELDELLSDMQKEDISIEESFLLFEKGTGLVRTLQKKLSELEGRIEQIRADGSTEVFKDGQ